MKTKVYWNTHKKCWSVKTGKEKVQHLDTVCLKDVKWVVQPAGRERARREGVKNVHAWALGTLEGKDEFPPFIGRSRTSYGVIYNPYNDPKFRAVRADEFEPRYIKSSQFAEFWSNGNCTAFGNMEFYDKRLLL